jgi:hypothetical protein
MGPTAALPWSSRFAVSARGISPRAAHRSGRDTLASSGPCHRMRLPPSAEQSGSSRYDPVDPSLTAMTCSLRTAGITALPRYYGAVRPEPPHRYFRPRGWRRLRRFPQHRRVGSQVPTKVWSTFAPPTYRMSLGGARCDAHCSSRRSLSRAGRGTFGFEEVGNRLNDSIRATSFQDCHQIRAPPICRSDEVASHFFCGRQRIEVKLIFETISRKRLPRRSCS